MLVLALMLVSSTLVSPSLVDNSLLETEKERTLAQDENNSLQKAITYKSAGK